MCSKAVANTICLLHNVVQITFEPSATLICRFFYLLHTFLSLNQSSHVLMKLTSFCHYVFAPCRIWFVGVNLHLVRMGELVGKGGPLTVASVRPAGRDFTVMSQVSPVR